MLSPLGQVRQISVGNKKAKSHWQYHWYCAMYVLFDTIRKANVYPHDPFTGKGHHLYLSLIYEPTTSPQWRIQGRGPGARTSLFLGQSEVRRAEKIRVWMTPPPPHHLIRRSRSATVSSASPTLILENLVITWLYTAQVTDRPSHHRHTNRM